MENLEQETDEHKKIGEHYSGWIYSKGKTAWITTGLFTLYVDDYGRFTFQPREVGYTGAFTIDRADVPGVIGFMNEFRGVYHSDPKEWLNFE